VQPRKEEDSPQQHWAASEHTPQLERGRRQRAPRRQRIAASHAPRNTRIMQQRGLSHARHCAGGKWAASSCSWAARFTRHATDCDGLAVGLSVGDAVSRCALTVAAAALHARDWD
jgi:hypothetical protein